jgi:tetratricopeptide (TPR) repeat protein
MRRVHLLALSLVAASAAAQAPPTFREGVIAFEKGEWAKAETAMRSALAVNPTESEGTVSIAGAWFETYVPHYFLARALAKQGKCKEALKEFEESERQGVTPAISDFARHLKSRGGCRPQGSTPKSPGKVAEVTVPFGEEETTTRAPEAVKPALVEKPPVKPSPVKPVVSVPPSIRRPSIDVRAQAERAALSAVMTEYVRGRYAEAVRLADATQFTDRTIAAEVALFRAASRYALYRIGGKQDETLQRAIELDLETYRTMRGRELPDPRVFPPSFIAKTR